MNEFKLRRLGMLMEPEPGNPLEVEGVLNPAAVRGPDGELYLFLRMVAKGNYSRIGIVRVRFNESGDPVGVERLGIALGLEAAYEHRPDGSGGCEVPASRSWNLFKATLCPTRHFRLKGQGSLRPYRRTSSTGSVSAWQPTFIGTALNWATWTTKMRAYSLSQSLTPPGN